MGDTACLQNNPFYCHEKPPVVSCWGLRSQKCLNLILLHCWKRHSRHFPVILSSRRLFFNCFCFCFLLFIFFGRQSYGADTSSVVSKSCWIHRSLRNFGMGVVVLRNPKVLLQYPRIVANVSVALWSFH